MPTSQMGTVKAQRAARPGTQVASSLCKAPSRPASLRVLSGASPGQGWAVGSGQSSREVKGWYSLMHVALGAGCEVRLHDRLELRLVAAVFEDRVVMVTAKDEGFVIREPGAVEAKVVAAFVVRVRLTDPEVCGQDWNTETPGLPGSPW